MINLCGLSNILQKQSKHLIKTINPKQFESRGIFFVRIFLIISTTKIGRSNINFISLYSVLVVD